MAGTPTEVRYSDAPRDAQRRDFTVNALFEDPATGEILDYVDGRRDIRRRVLRAIGDAEARFREDRLRMLRAVRLAVQLDFAIEPETFEAIRELAPLVSAVSARAGSRRDREDASATAAGGLFACWRRAACSRSSCPRSTRCGGSTQPPAFHPEGDVFVHTCLMLDAVDVPACADAEERQDEEEALLLATLLHDVAKPVTRTVDPDGRIRFNGHDAQGAEMAEAILERLRYPASHDRPGRRRWSARTCASRTSPRCGRRSSADSSATRTSTST